MRTELVTPPAEEPVTLAQAKAHLRVEVADEDALIAGLIAAARQVCETRLRRALITQTWEWDLYLDGWPYGGGYFNRAIRQRGEGPGWLPTSGGCPIEFPRPPLQSVTAIEYLDSGGVLRTLDPALYRVTTGTPGRLQAPLGVAWPFTQAGAIDPVRIRFVAGYGAAAACPAAIKQAMLLLIGHWYASREAVVIGTIVAELPMAVAALLAAEDWGSYA